MKGRRQSASTTEEKEYLSGSGITVASSRLFFPVSFPCPFLLFPCWDLRSSLGSWGSKREPLAGPKWGRLVQEILSALTWISHCRRLPDPNFWGRRKMYFRPSEVLRISQCCIRSLLSFTCWNLRTSLGSWSSKGESLAGPKCGRLEPVRRSLLL